ncbi:hypothetical protein FGO68_gene15705 [Halteria grandinella]|uniref:Uncharacterized protein n=1 Tax=Halteria grandinella TaxID=5974 RepID=A0A8J8P0K9_HALGN|nr:hypothetical protein FGO68_gene15705 [Halteria grandinella]
MNRVNSVEYLGRKNDQWLEDPKSIRERIIFRLLMSAQAAKKRLANFAPLLPQDLFVRKQRRHSLILSRRETAVKESGQLFNLVRIFKENLPLTNMITPSIRRSAAYSNQGQASDKSSVQMSFHERFNFIMKHQHAYYREVKAFKKRISRELGLKTHKIMHSGPLSGGGNESLRYEQSSSESYTESESESKTDKGSVARTQDQLDTDLGQADAESEKIRVRRTEGFFLERYCCKQRPILSHNHPIIEPKPTQQRPQSSNSNNIRRRLQFLSNQPQQIVNNKTQIQKKIYIKVTNLKLDDKEIEKESPIIDIRCPQTARNGTSLNFDLPKKRKFPNQLVTQEPSEGSKLGYSNNDRSTIIDTELRKRMELSLKSRRQSILIKQQTHSTQQVQFQPPPTFKQLFPEYIPFIERYARNPIIDSEPSTQCKSSSMSITDCLTVRRAIPLKK